MFEMADKVADGADGDGGLFELFSSVLTNGFSETQRKRTKRTKLKINVIERAAMKVTIRIGEPVRSITTIFKTRDRFVDLVIYQRIGIHDENILGLNVRVDNFTFVVKKLQSL